jgi:hypothetical protein
MREIDHIRTLDEFLEAANKFTLLRSIAFLGLHIDIHGNSANDIKRQVSSQVR